MCVFVCLCLCLCLCLCVCVCVCACVCNLSRRKICACVYLTEKGAVCKFLVFLECVRNRLCPCVCPCVCERQRERERGREREREVGGRGGFKKVKACQYRKKREREGIDAPSVLCVLYKLIRRIYIQIHV